jgi:hypothetical protein
MRLLNSLALPPDQSHQNSMASRKDLQAANWEPANRPKPASRYGIPAIYLNLEVGLSFSDEARTHSASMKYASKRMEERLHEQRIRQQYEEGRYSSQHPSFLMPANGQFPAAAPEQQTPREQQQQRQRRLGVNTREQRERATSAPPTTLDRDQPLSPVSPLTAMPETPGTLLTTPAMDRANQPLPPTPSQFRLGEADMPWSMDPYYHHPLEPETPPHEYSQALDEETRRYEDDKRSAGDLEALHLAMMTVDNFDDGLWSSFGERRNRWGGEPRSIGWAVSSEDDPLLAPQHQLPPYRSGLRAYRPFSRPRTAGS